MGQLFDKIAFRLRANAERLKSCPRTLYWRLMGMRVGEGTFLPQMRVTWPHQVSIGMRCIVEHGVFFKYDGIWNPGPSIIIGDDAFIGNGCEFNIHEKIAIGKQVMIAAGCKFIDHQHGYSNRNLPMIKQQSSSKAQITLGDDVWIGASVVVLDGVAIGHGAIVGAGSVVLKAIPEFEIWAGVPARKIGTRGPASAALENVPH